MVQIKKDEVREHIESAALRVFAQKGYAEARIADISAFAGVSIGNIYRYYKNKDEIFNSIIPESLSEQMRYIIIGKIDAAKDGLGAGSAAFQDITSAFIRFMLTNRERMTIIFSGSKGTRYEYLESEMAEALVGAVKYIFSQKYAAYIKKYGSDSIIRLIYQNLFRMYGEVMRKETTAQEAAVEIAQINLYHVSGITSLFEV